MLICTPPTQARYPCGASHGMVWGFLIPRCGGFQVAFLPRPAFSGGLRCFSVNRSICYCELRFRAIEIQPMGVHSAGSWESFRLGALKGLGGSVKGREFGGQNPSPFYFCFSGSRSRHLSD